VRANLDKPRKKKRRRADESAANETPLGVKTPLWVEKNHTRTSCGRTGLRLIHPRRSSQTISAFAGRELRVGFA
jgi:hypothetical protein